ncbi:MAG: hypothetical protein K0U98_10335 [Deltaproteobacteria bacterium]|nr:hypothetical protein [Deltaproteobacteria bacterium]
MMKGSRASWVTITAWSGFVLLMLLHVDFWRSQRAVLHFGWLPEDVLYRLLWMVLAWGYLVFFTKWVWKGGE